MSGIMDMITQQLGSSMMQQMASKIGGDNDGIKRAAAVAVPMIISALQKMQVPDKVLNHWQMLWIKNTVVGYWII